REPPHVAIDAADGDRVELSKFPVRAHGKADDAVGRSSAHVQRVAVTRPRDPDPSLADRSAVDEATVRRARDVHLMNALPDGRECEIRSIGTRLSAGEHVAERMPFACGLEAPSAWQIHTHDALHRRGEEEGGADHCE